ncbi:serine/threonine protein kinase, partial [Frankia sp. CNm7]|uniref:serine/threonine-protein kinase n=1 Tax=Frankia nepalensis TaxID=1836974 RepID=UPI001931D8DA
MPLTPLTDTDPARIAGFRLVARLGAGGMGVVYVGADQAGRPVAIKLVRTEYAEHPEFRARFRREVSAARAVEGTCTARLIDADPDARSPWLATEYVAGTSLAEVVAAEGPLPPELLRAFAAGLAEALCAIHAAGVAHRDLKPANVLLAADGPKVIDFGIAAAIESTMLATHTGVGVGSPGFMAPEQVTGDAPVGMPVDVYAWGLTVVFAATGRAPFGVGRPEALLYRAVHGEVDLAGLPPALEPLVRAALDKDPARRPTAVALLARLTGPATAGAGAAARDGGGTVTADGEARAGATAGGEAEQARDAGDLASATRRLLREDWRPPRAAAAPPLPTAALRPPGPSGVPRGAGRGPRG